MRVGISAYLLHAGQDYRAAGVSTYIRHLLIWLPRARPDLQCVAFHGPDAPPLSNVESRAARVPTGRAAVRIAWEHLALPAQLARAGVDLVHGTVNVVPVLAPVPAVVTLHDLSFLRLSDRFPRHKVAYLRTAVQWSVRRAERIIAVSEHTRQDAHELLGVPTNRVIVVPQGVDERFQPADVAPPPGYPWPGRPYILHVGTLEPRKNLDVLIAAFGALHAAGLPHALVLAGAPGWMYENLYAQVETLRLQGDIHFAGYVRPDDLPRWYNHADLFVYPSAYEGFGLPVLEALACGTPAVVSRSSALVELAEGAALLVEPGSVEALEQEMMAVLRDSHLRSSLRALGLERAGHYSWRETARKTACVYDQVMAEAAGSMKPRGG